MNDKVFKYIGLTFTEDSLITDDMVHFWDEFMSDSLDVLCHTSGSTGTPKDILIPKSAMLYSAKNTVRFFNFNEQDIALLCLPAKYIGGRMMMVRALLSKMKIYSADLSLNPLLGKIFYPVTFAAFTPSQVSQILKEELSSRRFKSIHKIIIGGAPISAELEKLLAKMPNDIYVTYGMTETVSHIALRKVGHPYYQKISEETLLGTNENGCLWIHDLNYSQEILQTNDIVTLVNENEFEWHGRFDFVINSGGIKLHPEQIEEKIKSLSDWASHQFFISKISDDKFGERPLLVVLQSDSIPSLDSLAEVLSKIEMPQQIAVASKFIYTESGKLNRVETLKFI